MQFEYDECTHGTPLNETCCDCEAEKYNMALLEMEEEVGRLQEENRNFSQHMIELVAEFENYRKILDGCKDCIKYKIHINPNRTSERRRDERR